MAYNNTYRGLEGQIVRDTDKAILFKVINKDTGAVIKQEWFPKSQLASFGGTYDEIDGTYNFILVSEWLLGQKGLLSSSVPKESIRQAGMNPAISAPYKGNLNNSTLEKQSRAGFKDDEGPISGDDDPNGYFDRWNTEE